MKSASLIVYLCAAVLVILGVYSFFMAKDIFSGILWTALGIVIAIIGYIKLK